MDQIFKENIDAWIKQIRREVSNLKSFEEATAENVTRTQHNYELIYELKDEVAKLKSELLAMQLVQLIVAKTNQQEKKII